MDWKAFFDVGWEKFKWKKFEIFKNKCVFFVSIYKTEHGDSVNVKFIGLYPTLFQVKLG